MYNTGELAGGLAESNWFINNSDTDWTLPHSCTAACLPQMITWFSLGEKLQDLPVSFKLTMNETKSTMETGKFDWLLFWIKKYHQKWSGTALYMNYIQIAYTVDSVDTVDLVYTVDMMHNEESFHTRLSYSNVSMGNTGWRLKRPLESDCHTGVQKYFLIDCRTRVSRSIF